MWLVSCHNKIVRVRLGEALAGCAMPEGRSRQPVARGPLSILNFGVQFLALDIIVFLPQGRSMVCGLKKTKKCQAIEDADGHSTTALLVLQVLLVLPVLLVLLVLLVPPQYY